MLPTQIFTRVRQLENDQGLLMHKAVGTRVPRNDSLTIKIQKLAQNLVSFG